MSKKYDGGVYMNNVMKSIRTLHGYSSREMADVLGISIYAYLRIEKKAIDEMKLGMYKTIMRHFKINPLEAIQIFTDPQSDPL